LAVWTLINIIFKKILKFSPKIPSSKEQEFLCEGKTKEFSKNILGNLLFSKWKLLNKKKLFENKMFNLLQDLFYFKDSM